MSHPAPSTDALQQREAPNSLVVAIGRCNDAAGGTAPVSDRAVLARASDIVECAASELVPGCILVVYDVEAAISLGAPANWDVLTQGNLHMFDVTTVVAAGEDRLLRIRRLDVPLPAGMMVPLDWNGLLLMRISATATVFTVDGAFIEVAETARAGGQPPAKKARTDGDQPDGEPSSLSLPPLPTASPPGFYVDIDGVARRTNKGGTGPEFTVVWHAVFRMCDGSLAALLIGHYLAKFDVATILGIFRDRAMTALEAPPPRSADDMAAAGFTQLAGRAVLNPTTLTAFVQFKFPYADYSACHLADFGPQGRTATFYPPSLTVHVDDSYLDFVDACFAGFELALCVFFNHAFAGVCTEIRARLADPFFRMNVNCSRAFLDFRLMSPLTTLSRAVTTEPPPAGSAPRAHATATYWRGRMVAAFAGVRLPDSQRDDAETRRFPAAAAEFNYGAKAAAPLVHPIVPPGQGRNAKRRAAKAARTPLASAVHPVAAVAAVVAPAVAAPAVAARLAMSPAVAPVGPRACGFHVVNMLRPDLIARGCDRAARGVACDRSHPTAAQLTKAIALDASGLFRDPTERETFKTWVAASNLPQGL